MGVICPDDKSLWHVNAATGSEQNMKALTPNRGRTRACSSPWTVFHSVSHNAGFMPKDGTHLCQYAPRRKPTLVSSSWSEDHRNPVIDRTQEHKIFLTTASQSSELISELGEDPGTVPMVVGRLRVGGMKRKNGIYAP